MEYRTGVLKTTGSHLSTIRGSVTRSACENSFLDRKKKQQLLNRGGARKQRRGIELLSFPVLRRLSHEVDRSHPEVLWNQGRKQIPAIPEGRGNPWLQVLVKQEGKAGGEDWLRIFFQVFGSFCLQPLEDCNRKKEKERVNCGKW